MCVFYSSFFRFFFISLFFFFQAEDGIRDIGVTGVQTCALPIFHNHLLCVAVEVEAEVSTDALHWVVLEEDVGGHAPQALGATYRQELAQEQGAQAPARSEEHTSELQSRQYLVCRLLLEKKKKIA